MSDFSGEINKPKQVFLIIPIFFSLMILVGLFSIISFQVKADNGIGGDREKVAEVTVTEYTWDLVSNSTGETICELKITHTGVPSALEVATICAKNIPLTLSSPTPPLPVGMTTPQAGTTIWEYDYYITHNSWRLREVKEVTRFEKIKLPRILISVDIPNSVVDVPYVLISAYDPVPEYSIVSIHGIDNSREFECAGSKCKLFLTGDTYLEFWARSSSGDESEHVKAEIRVTSPKGGNQVSISSLSPPLLFNDVCADIWKAKPLPSTTWNKFPSSPDQLNTKKNLFYLANQLMSAGIASTSECPNNGLLASNSPSSCGMEKANTAMVKWQNQYDPAIWIASQDVGIPPRILKTLIEIESQFWPANSQFILVEYGLGQLNELGVDVLLRWDDTMYEEACKGVLSDCSTPYYNLPSWQQALLRGAIMQMVNPDCQNCVHGIDSLKTQQSVNIIAHTIRANCTQTKHILDLTRSTASYEDFWHLTLVSYHSGYQCLLDAVNTTKKLNEKMDWEHVSANLDCNTGKSYVNDFFYSLENFDASRYIVGKLPGEYLLPNYLPTPTPIPSPTPFLSRGSIKVLAYIDMNMNGTTEDNERINDAVVRVLFDDGTYLTQIVSNGEAILDMTGRIAGTEVTISLQNYDRDFGLLVPESGETLVVFRLEQPVLPEILP